MTDKITLLEKLVQIQSSIIEGHSLKAILRKETAFFKGNSGADVIAVCIENEKHVDIELVLEQSHQFLFLLRKYKLLPKDMELDRFIERCSSHFSGSQEHIQIKSLDDIFQGTLSKKKLLDFEAEMGFDTAHIFPIHNKNSRKIGFVIYFFNQGAKALERALRELTEVFEVLIRPFHNEEQSLMHAKCIKVDEKMHRLTDKEKQIAHRVLLGKQHKAIAEEMQISVNTLKTHMKNIFSKYGVNSKIELHNKLTG
mgnify:CR=1 FL=1